jgi:hypothetical protein
MPAQLHFSKLDVALRQLETAVTLYFHSADPVSIHTLTAAAYNVLRDLKTHRGSEFKCSRTPIRSILTCERSI